MTGGVEEEDVADEEEDGRTAGMQWRRLAAAGRGRRKRRGDGKV